MSGTHILGNYGADSPFGPRETRYFYALRVNDDGELFFTRVDQWTEDDEIIINAPGFAEDDWEFFENGIDYFEGRDAVTKDKVKKNLYHDQYKFDARSLFYYFDDNGELILRVNKPYNYPQDSIV
jgi:hypothetical protein